MSVRLRNYMPDTGRLMIATAFLSFKPLGFLDRVTVSVVQLNLT